MSAWSLYGQSEYKIAPQLLQSLQESPDQMHDIYILLEDRVDLENLAADFDRRNTPYSQRAIEVQKALISKADHTQKDLLERISSISSIAFVQSYWINNIVAVRAPFEAALLMTEWEGVERLYPKANAVLESVLDERPAEVLSSNIEAGLEKINAPQMWALGYSGYGTTAFINDTGVEPTHDALETQYRGNIDNYSYNSFFEETEIEEWAFDCGDHGTHVAGTVLGLDRLTNDTIGVAFNGNWIGAAILCGTGTDDNVGAFQWALNPDGDINTSEDIPTVINNSWYDPSLESACDNIYVDMLNALDVSGVAVVFSAGNAGPGPSSITNPHNINTDLVNTFTVGALNGNTNSLPIADFSSRGPSLCPGEGSIKIKPEVSAPGVSVRSCLPNGEYGFKSGTSMAAPHVAGAIMLLKEAFPQLGGTELKMALYTTAVDLGATGEDNTFGMGIIDVFAAFNYLAQSYEPADPSYENDLIVHNLEMNPYHCSEGIEGSFWIQNGGTSAIEGAIYTLSFGSYSATFTIDQTIEPQASVKVDITDLIGLEGEDLFEVNVFYNDATQDDRPLNNKVKRFITSSDYTSVQIQEANQGETLCIGSQASLYAEATNGFDMDVEWFNTPNLNAVPFSTENPLHLSLTQESQTLYAMPTYKAKAGEKPSASNEQMGGLEDKGILFDLEQDVLLRSVTLDVQIGGIAIVKVLDEDNEVINQRINPVQPGIQEVVLSFPLEAGQNYKLVFGNGSTEMGFVQTEASFPYAIEDYMVLKSSLDDLDTENVSDYLFFYDIELKINESCDPVAYTLEATGEGGLSELSFSSSNQSVDLSENPQVQFSVSEDLEDLGTFAWTFGDGGTSSESNPLHTYSQSGDMLVQLVFTDLEGCKSSYSQVIEVINSQNTATKEILSEERRIDVFPNPAISGVDVMTFGLEILDIGVLDVDGKSYSTPQSFIASDHRRLDLGDLDSGIYMVQITTPQGIRIVKLIRL